MLKSRYLKSIDDVSGDGGTVISYGSVGRPLPGDALDDPLNLYVPGSGLSLTISDYSPLKIIKGFSVVTVGNINVTFVNGSRETLTIANGGDDSPIYPGFINTIHKTGTTAQGIKPLL